MGSIARLLFHFQRDGQNIELYLFYSRSILTFSALNRYLTNIVLGTAILHPICGYLEVVKIDLSFQFYDIFLDFYSANLISS